MELQVAYLASLRGAEKETAMKKAGLLSWLLIAVSVALMVQHEPTIRTIGAAIWLGAVIAQIVIGVSYLRSKV